VLLLAVGVLTACQSSSSVRKRGYRPESGAKLAVLPAESAKFPEAARKLTESLSNANVAGIETKEVSKVSLEVVQLSIECVEPSPKCYAAVGKSLAASRLLFAQVSGRSHKVKVTVTLFDVDKQSPKIAEKTFGSEKEATAGIADLVAEATR